MYCSKTALARRLSFAFGSSMLAVAATFASPAFAQCSPEPTVAGGTTTCIGTDADGLRVTTDDSTVHVVPSASVTALDRSAITVDIDWLPNGPIGHSATIIVGGIVDGSAHSGIAVLSGSVPTESYNYYRIYPNVTVEAGAIVTGATGITVEPSPGNYFGRAVVNISNAGAITGTGGVALLATDPGHGSFGVIDNAQGGTIGAIIGSIGELNNAGSIDGGSLSAIDQTSTSNWQSYPNGWTNSGTIRSASTAATIANLTTPATPLINSGMIANTGTGAAIEGRSDESRLTITNLAGGHISAAGGPAIVANTVTLLNAGTITGDIVTEPAFGTYFYSIIDSTEGTINGNVSLGSGNDLVYGRYDGTITLATGITGTLDAGAGTNILVLAPETDLVVSTAITLPGGFQRLRLAPGENATLTLAQGFVAPGTIELDGYGSIVNQAAIQISGQAFVLPHTVSGSPGLINTGSIDATVAPFYFALDLGHSGRLENSGAITSSGDGILSGDRLVNSGTIVAANTALSMFNGSLDNSGTIRSTGGVGVDLSGNTDNTPALNSGTIEGATYGAITGYVLNNNGTIRATGNGTAVGLDGYGVLNNLAGGVIEGGAWAITGHDSYGSTRTYNATVFNAGTINGDVTFVAPINFSWSNNSYIALSGGVLNGNLTLGEGDTLVTDFINTGEGQFAGINGTVSTTGGLLRYRVSGETNAVVGAVGPFASAGYELLDGAHLTLSTATPQVLTLILAGDGTVDMTVDIDATDRSALRVVAAAVTPGFEQDDEQALHIISRGTLSLTKTDYHSGSFAAASLNWNAAFKNEGTIRAFSYNSPYGQVSSAAVAYGGTLINNGRIELDGSYGTYAVLSVVNSGTIAQTGSQLSYGIWEAGSIDNSGTIQTLGYAISHSGSLTNSGLVASIGQAAIMNVKRIDNLAGGTILGGDGTAVQGGESVVNAGMIVGDVNLGAWYLNGAAYYAAGGTLTGNLTLGTGDDLFLQTGETSGISGTIDAGDGNDIYGIALTSSGTVAVGPAPGTGFENAMVAALGTNTVATVTGIDAAFTDLHVAGDGTVVNTAALLGRVVVGSTRGSGQAAILGETLGDLVNSGSIAGGVIGSADRLHNSGTILDKGSHAAAILAWGESLDLRNSGRIEASGDSSVAIRATYVATATIRNSGTIVGAIMLGEGNDLVVNSGTMGHVYLGAGDDIFRLEGGSFTSSVDGGWGRDSVEITDGEAGFSAITNVEVLRMSGGLARLSGDTSFEDIALTGGRLIGLEGSTITAAAVSVGQMAVFGSAGIVNGNLAVSGSLSPGASPGTMTVNGNLSLAGSSISIFEITQTVSDKLIVNGNLTIAPGATLKVDALELVDAGQSRELIVAEHISGGFTNIVLSGSLFGVIVQQNHTISLLGQFLNDPSFTPQVQRSVAYVNDLLISGNASQAFLSAAPTLNEAAFAQLPPEAYASASQISIEHGLELADAGRSSAFATKRDSPGPFTFASLLGSTRTMGSSAEGTARTRVEGYGLLAGIAWGSSDWSVGGFVGYLNSRQTLSSLSARTEVDGLVAGVHGRWTNGSFGLKAMVAYDGGNADTRRNLPAGTAGANYRLTGWTGDFSLDYAMPLGRSWTAQPGLGLTIIGTSRNSVRETGGSVYALEVARERDQAIFVDGSVTFRAGVEEGAVARPYVAIGMRYQVDGRSPIAMAAMDGGDFGLVAAGAPRAPLLATGALGADIVLNSRLVMFGAVNGEAGDADLRAGIRAGLRLAF